MTNRLAVFATALALSWPLAAPAKVSQAEADRLGADLTPLGAEKAGNADGTIPAWDGGYSAPKPPDGQERHPENFPLTGNDKPIAEIMKANMVQYEGLLTEGAKALLNRFPTYRMPLYPTRRTGNAVDFFYAATKRNATTADLANQGESLVDAVTGIPFPIPQSGIEVIWNHKLRYRGTSLERYNVQLAVQANGAFQPYKLREDIRFHYNLPDQTVANLGNVLIYFLQYTTAPERQVGNVTLVHETMDQVKEPRRAWLYNPGQRRIRRAPNVAYDNPGNGSDGLRTNDQLDSFNGATDRYTWKLVGKREMIVPYNASRLGDSRLKYSQIAGKGHLNQDLARYERHRVWIVEAQLKPGISHIYRRRTFYVDEDTWSIVAVDCYDGRNQLWRIQESHPVILPWLKRVGPAASTVYDLHSGRYLVMDLSNEEPLFRDVVFDVDHFSTGSVQRMASK